MNIEFLSTKFVEEYVKNNPNPLNELGEFVYYRTYSRWLQSKGRREYWHETVKRAIEYNMSLEYKRLLEVGYPIDLKGMKQEAENLFKSIYETKQFPSGRTLWLGNANEVVNKEFALGNFNCAFLNIKTWEDLSQLFYLLMVGTGVGFRSTKKSASKMPRIRINTTLLHSEYKPVLVKQRLENTKVVKMDNGFAKIYVGDSKNGWIQALKEYFDLLTQKEHEDIHTIKVSYNSVRPKGERLKTFGGTASGFQPLKEMFEGIDNVFKNKIDSYLDPIVADEKGYGQVRPIHILDIGNLIGANVVVGGVRRTAEIFLFDSDDYESVFAKYGINGLWTEEQLKHHKEVSDYLDKKGIKPEWFNNLNNIGDMRKGLDHRRMSNNSVAFTKKPSREELHLQFVLLQGEGEPCYVNLEEAARRVAKAIGYKNPSQSLLNKIMDEIGLNPCVEIILFSKNVCNLTTLNIIKFIKTDVNGNKYLDLEDLLDSQRMSARIGMRMTLITLELPEWNKTQKRDGLIGTSVTGWKDAMAMLNYTEEQEFELMNLMSNASRQEADKYAKYLRVSPPLLTTAVKPEGTLSQVAGGVSSGLHWSHSPYYIRRIRINSNDPLVDVAKELEWNINPEVGTVGETFEEKMNNARTYVIDFPIASGATRTKDDITVEEQFDTYFKFQKYYTEHNSSNTITVKPDEWGKAEQIVWDNWDDFVGVSFLSYDGGTYQLAPYEAISKEEYEISKAKMKPFDATLLRKYEKSETETDLENMESCSSGVCPIR